MMNNKKSNYWQENKTTIMVLSIIVVFGIAALIYPKKEYPPVTAERLAIDPYLGDETAAVIIIEYGDYACSGCKLWHNAGILDEILEQFDGKVKFVWRDNAHISTASIAAANAAQCAYDQGQFWEYHDLLFDNPRGFSEEGLKGYALDLGLNPDQFNLCVDQGLYVNKVFNSMKLAGDDGLSQTPSFLVNDQIIIGPPSTSYLSSLITKLLEE